MLILRNTQSTFFLWTLLRALFVVVIWLPIPLALSLAFYYGAMLDSVQASPLILEPPAGSATQVYTVDGTPIGGLVRGRAPWAGYNELPPLLVEAFLAAEDDDFFLHGGVDLRAIARAAIANFQSGSIQQGGSTITQQLAKVFVGQSRTYERKLIELLLSRRIEANYSKEDILEAYLNRIYLGAGAYGVRAAALMYFDQTLEGLSLAEVAVLAGIASAPSSFEPYDHPERARIRRNLVLDRMSALGFASAESARLAAAEPLVLRERGEVPERLLPFLTDQIRLDVRDEFGPDAWRHGGLRVVAATSLTQQRTAEAALLDGVEAIDHRQGYRGPLRSGLSISREAFDELTQRHFPEHQRRRPALVEAVEANAILVWSDGLQIELGPDSWRWASPFDVESEENAVEVESAIGLVTPGDVVLVSHSPEGPALLTQVPRLEGSLSAMDLDSGYLVAMAAGTDYDRSQFNRVTRACRQPGSTFKPVVFSRALDLGMTLATPLIDVPMQLFQGGIEIWRPRNADGNFHGDLLLRDALIRSRNLPTIRVYKRVGAYNVIERARSLGFTTPMESVDSLSLGASCVYPIDVTTAYGVFANGGYRNRPTSVVTVVSGRSELIADRGAFFDSSGEVSAILHRAYRDLSQIDYPVINPTTAYLITFVLRDVVRMGTGHAARELGHPAAGKTGTTNAFDAWFVGFTERLVTTVWVGTDRNSRPLGRGEHGSEVALPIWLDFMQKALDGVEQHSLTDPLPPGIHLIRVDVVTGLLAQEGAPGVWLPFREGTEPVEFAMTPEQLDMRALDRVDRDF